MPATTSLTPQQHELASALLVLLQRLPATYALQIASVPVLPDELAGIMTAALTAPVAEAQPLTLPSDLVFVAQNPHGMAIMEVPLDARCSMDLQMAGQPYQRTCKTCGLGPCPNRRAA